MNTLKETAANPLKSITSPEARYLKHAGEMYDVKVSVHVIGMRPVIHIRDWEFTTFEKALLCLQHIVETEIISSRLEVAS